MYVGTLTLCAVIALLGAMMIVMDKAIDKLFGEFEDEEEEYGYEYE